MLKKILVTMVSSFFIAMCVLVSLLLWQKNKWIDYSADRIGKPSQLISTIINDYKKRNPKSVDNFSMATLHLQIRPDEIKAYQMLQLQMAKMIPIEEKRPTIDLKIKENVHYRTMKFKRDRELSSFGILGGIGPLSDSYLVAKVIKKISKDPINWNYMTLHLFSSPPPRTFAAKLQRGLIYLWNLRNFFLKDVREFYIASNSAHLNIGFLDFLGGSKGKIFNLSKSVQKEIIKKGEEEGKYMLLLTTLKGAKNGLYQYKTIDDPNNYKMIKLNRDSLVEIQKNIDHIKRGEIDFAYKNTRRIILNHLSSLTNLLVVFGCTEFSIPFPASIKKKIMKEAMSMNKSIHFIDSENIFVSNIYSRIKKMITVK